MLTILLIILISMMVFSTLIVLLVSMSASRSSRWEEQYWEELAIYDRKQEKEQESDPSSLEKIDEAELVSDMTPDEAERKLAERSISKKTPPTSHPPSPPPSPPTSSRFKTRPRSA